MRLTCPVNPLSVFPSLSLFRLLSLPYDKFAHCSAELMMSFCLVFCFGCQPPRRIREQSRVATHQGTGYRVPSAGYRVPPQTTDRTGTQILICACSTSCCSISAQSRSPPNESRAMMLIAMIVCRSLCFPQSVMSVVSVSVSDLFLCVF